MSKCWDIGNVSEKVLDVTCKDMTISFTGDDGRHYKTIIPKADIKINRNKDYIYNGISYILSKIDSFDIDINIMPDPENEENVLLKLIVED